MELKLSTLAGLEQVATAFLEANQGKRLFAFYGPMGAGKTTFVKALCQALKSIDVASSPTFSIINEYHTEGNGPIFHFDFYRIEDTEEVYNLGYEDYFYSNHYCFLEWPERVEGLLPEHVVKVQISVQEDGERVISF